jgi:hypothetical protein
VSRPDEPVLFVIESGQERQVWARGSSGAFVNISGPEADELLADLEAGS